MKHLLLLVCLFVTFQCVHAQPSTEIILFDLVMKKHQLSAVNGVNISAHKGYDNQPFFHPEKSILYYTSADENGNTDLIHYDYSSKKKVKFTSTPDREYSPTVTPDQKFISCISQRENGKQDLIKYPIGGGDPVVIIDNLTIGYHAWLNDSSLMVFVLGEPNTLRRYDIVTGKDTVLATNIGRSLHRVPPDHAGISFVQKTDDSRWIIKWTDGVSAPSNIADALPGREDLAWTGGGWLVMSDGNSIFASQPGKPWIEVNVTSSYPVRNITRVAVDPKTNKLAVVTEE